MKKILFILFLSLVLVSTKSFSQAYSSYSSGGTIYSRGYVYLKDGRILKGRYIYSVDLSKIQIVTKEETVVLNADEVERITRNKPNKEKKPRESYYYDPENDKSSNFFNITDMGFLIGNPDNKVKNPFFVHTSFNYTFLPGLSAGLGLGVEIYKETYLPALANITYQFGKKQMKPFVSLLGGYNIPITGTNMSIYDVSPKYPGYSSLYYPIYYNTEKLDTKGGLLVNPSVGFIYQLSDGLGLGLSLGYRYHQLNYITETDYRLMVEYNRLTMKLSFIFN